MNLFETIICAFFAGLLPALLWLWFWLHEDKKNPEPRSTIAFTFTTGMGMIFLAIPLESYFNSLLGNPNPASTNLIVIWAVIEEVLKFLAVFVAALQSSAYDEPLDAVIYMICAALGFAALENTLFILKNFHDGVLSSLFLTNLRFIGANLLHVVASSTIGVAIALSFYKKRKQKIYWTIGGLATAIILHTIFNLFIIEGSTGGIFLVFLLIWLLMIGLALMFEKIKKMKMVIIRK